jgi:hypothetical protein
MNARAWTILTLVLAGGCSATVVPPAAPKDPVAVYLTDYGRHSSILLPNAAGAELTEYAWGEWDWFALGDAHWYTAPRTLFFAKDATLGMRTLPMPSNIEALTNKLGADSIVRIECSGKLVEALREQLNEKFSARSVTLMNSSYSELWQVKDDSEHYWLGHNCNHVTARWLKELGCKIEGSPVLSHFKVTRVISASSAPSN